MQELGCLLGHRVLVPEGETEHTIFYTFLTMREKMLRNGAGKEGRD
jgi:hypothetical protein